MSIGGGLLGTLVLDGTAPFPAGRTISIGNSLAASGIVNVSTAGALGGQVVINKNNSGGAWASGGLVIVGPSGNQTVLTTPTYSTPSATLGGGAVGQARFHLHNADCIPTPGSTLTQTIDTVTLAHYGPVQWSSFPVLVQLRDSDPNGSRTWTDLPSSDFLVSLAANGRDVIVQAGTSFDFKPGYDYRITPIAGALQCAAVTGNPDVDAWEYILYGQ